MTPNEDSAFTAFLLAKAAEAEALGYRPTLFKQMVGAQGGYVTVRQLLSKGKPSEGFTRLWELKRLDLTVEALVVETKWRSLFDPILVQQAERLLKQVAYPLKPFAEDSPVNGSPKSPIAEVTPAPARAPAPQGPGSPSPRKNTRSFTEFCTYVGAKFVNPYDRWCGYNPERGFAVFTLWADRLQGDRYLLWDAVARSGDTRIGATELRRVLHEVMTRGHTAYGIRCEARDIHAAKRERGYFDEHHLLALTFEEVGQDVVARVTGEVLAADVALGRLGAVLPFESALDDLSCPPPGNLTPGRTAERYGAGYRRDQAVRDYVIRRSGGACEHCGARGFELPDGTHYVEAHHVIALSSAGPDTVENVIALCPLHHREAHYGKDAETLEKAFLARLAEISGK